MGRGRRDREYRVEDGCIRCGACAEIAEDLFGEREDGEGFEVLRQPRDESEVQAAQEALESCPVGVITASTDPVAPVAPEASRAGDVGAGAAGAAPQVIVAESKVRQTFERHPHLKEVMIRIDPVFRRLQNKTLWNTVARYATFRDAAFISKLSVCEILHELNEANGTLEQMAIACPECLEGGERRAVAPQGEAQDESGARELDLRDREALWLEKAVDGLQALSAGQRLVVRARVPLRPLMDRAEELHIRASMAERDGEVRHVFTCERGGGWRAENLEKLDVRGMDQDPFDVIMKKAYSVEDGGGFVLIQTFEPTPLINMLGAMDFEAEVERKGEAETWVTFRKRARRAAPATTGSGRVPVVIQSATPVAYPVIMRLLQSRALRDVVDIRELKVWEETEKHLGWIVDGRADISFTAVITMTRLAKLDVKMPAIFVWDNFYLLTRGYRAESLADVQGRTIHAPLFREAPPTALTRYLIRAHGLDEQRFRFSYGTPFGRPEQILWDFLHGRSDTVLLREPEASFALAGLDPDVTGSVLSYQDLWNDVHPGYGSFPNAGLLFKGAFVREHPDVARLVMRELASAIDWVNENRDAAARLSFDMMRHREGDVRRFLDRVHFRTVTGPELQRQAVRYLRILREEGIITTALPEDLHRVFELGLDPGPAPVRAG